MNDYAILCVDDEEMILTSLESLLEKYFGHFCNIELAESGEDGLDIITELIEENVHVVVIISDWLMPGMKGDEFLLRVNEMCPEMEKIMLSGQADENAVKKAQQQNVVDYFMHKPWDSKKLVKLISDGLKKHGCQISDII